jgi:hypothetical protein
VIVEVKTLNSRSIRLLRDQNFVLCEGGGQRGKDSNNAT